MSEQEIRIEWLKCSRSFAYFLDNYGYVFSAVKRDWIRFRLWPAQRDLAMSLEESLLWVVLKARQLGMTWLFLGFALWLMIFRASSTVLLFSRRDDEAVDLLDFRLKGMYWRLPVWMRARAVLADNDHEFRLSNGSVAMAFPTTGGDSYTANFVLVDEADLVPDLGGLLGSVKPTIDAGGMMVLLSRSNKKYPQSVFKRLFIAARAGRNAWRAVFLPWWSRPDRDAAWYEAEKRDVMETDGVLDRLYEQYPATPEEALAPNTLDKRLPVAWIAQCPGPGQRVENVLGLPGFSLWVESWGSVVLGVDVAEGNPNSNESSCHVVDVASGDEVAVLAGRFEPAVYAGYICELVAYFGAVGVLVERNNHGHVVLQWLRDHCDCVLILGPDERAGFLSNSPGKALLYSHAAEVLRDEAPAIYDEETRGQLASLEGRTLRAPAGMMDDRADSWAMAQLARGQGYYEESVVAAEGDILGGLGEVY